MEQFALLDALRPRIAMIVVLCIVATVAGYGFSYLLTEEYEASALVLVRPQHRIKITNDTTSDKEILGFPVAQSVSVETAGKTYIEIIKSTALVETVVRQLNLDRPREKKPGLISRLLPPFLLDYKDALKQQLKDLTQILKYGRVLEQNDFEKAVDEVKDNLSLESSEDTYVFDIAYTADDPVGAADVANTAAETFIQFMADVHASETKYVGDHLQRLLDASLEKLIRARVRMEEFQEAHGFFHYEEEYAEKLKVITELEIELEKLEAELQGSQGTLSVRRNEAKRTRLQRALKERKDELAPLPEMEREISLLDLDLHVARTTYEIVAKELKEAEIRHANPVPEIRLVSHAVPPTLPSGPARGRIALIALSAALVIGVGLAFLLEYVRPKVRGIQDLEELIGVKVLATIPRVARRRWRRAGL